MASRKEHKLLYVPIEILHRELISKLLLSFVAAEAGYMVVLGEQSRLHRDMAELPPGILFERGCGIGQPRAEMLKEVRAAGHRIVSSDEEAMSIYSVPDQWCRQRVEDKCFVSLDQYYAWGPKQAEIIQAHLGYRSDKFRNTGSYRMDVWQPRMAGLHDKEVQRIRAQHGKYILLPSNFSSRFVPLGAGHLLEKLHSMGMYLEQEEIDEFWDEMAYRDKVCDEFIRVLPTLSKAFPDHKIIIRPHPVEGVPEWQREIGEIDRVEIIYDGEVTPWLLASDAIFHHGCTTALEARQFGLSPITYRPLKSDQFDDTFLCDMGPNVDDPEALIGQLRAAIDGETLEFPLRETIDDYITPSRSELASDRIIAALGELDVEPRRLPIGLSVHVHRLRERLRPEAAKKTSRAARSRARFTSAPPKWPGLHTDEINRVLHQFQTMLGRFGDVRVDDFRRRMFMIYRGK